MAYDPDGREEVRQVAFLLPGDRLLKTSDSTSLRVRVGFR